MARYSSTRKMRGPIKFLLLILVAAVVFIGFKFFPAFNSAPHRRHSDADHHQHGHSHVGVHTEHDHARMINPRFGGKVGENKDVGVARHLPNAEAGRVDLAKMASMNRRNDPPRQRPPPVDRPDEEEEDDNEETVPVEEVKSGKSRPGQSETEPRESGTKSSSCALDEDNMYKDPNVIPLHEVCKLTVNDPEFKVWLKKKERLVHLDLKGAAPKPAYLLQLFPLMKEFGATGLLIEYEDMFPYSGELAVLASGDAYSVDDLKQILNSAKENGLMVMPLVQTFGHLEFVLKHEKFMKYRELDDIPQAISPCVEGTYELLTKMLGQVMDLHPDSEYFHIGADEVYDLGKGHCKSQIDSGQITKDGQFLKHIKEIAEFVQERKKITVMWDDMYRHAASDDIKTVAGLVEPMIWQYSTEVPRYITDEILLKYSKSFSHLWAASSFKGATGSNQYVTDTFNHLKNHMTWLKLMNKYADRIPFRGIAMTGWQRFDHFAMVCELLPPAVPTMAVCLQATVHGTITRETLEAISKSLKMTSTYKLKVPSMPRPDDLVCSFPGSDIYKAVMKLHATRYFLNIFEDRHLFAGWATKYHAKYNYHSPGQLKYAESKILPMMHNLTEIEKDMKSAMSDVFYADTIDEWVTVNLQSVMERLQAYSEYIKKVLESSPKHWPARPLHNKVIQPNAANDYGVLTFNQNHMSPQNNNNLNNNNNNKVPNLPNNLQSRNLQPNVQTNVDNNLRSQNLQQNVHNSLQLRNVKPNVNNNLQSQMNANNGLPLQNVQSQRGIQNVPTGSNIKETLLSKGLLSMNNIGNTNEQNALPQQARYNKPPNTAQRSNAQNGVPLQNAVANSQLQNNLQSNAQQQQIAPNRIPFQNRIPQPNVQNNALNNRVQNMNAVNAVGNRVPQRYAGVQTSNTDTVKGASEVGKTEEGESLTSYRRKTREKRGVLPGL